MSIMSKLKAPFRDDQIRYRVGATNVRKVRRQTNNSKARPTSGMALAYIDARDVYDRLDEVTGGAHQITHIDAGEGRLSCSIGIKICDEWVWKSDGAGGRQATQGLSEQDSNKGDFSDSLKRAAAAWGIGRYLYDMKNQWVSLDEWGQISKDMRPILDKNHAMLAQGKMPPAIEIKEVEPKPQSQPANQNKRMSKTDEARKTFERIKGAIASKKSIPELDKFMSNHHTKAALASLPEDWERDIKAAISTQEHMLSMAAADNHEKEHA